ncbi:amino acid adenylation domain-containing protein [Catenulispora sp. NL8]|uniref:Amino acid adenylation domain-containing protein n=1 Tax=Catenulispora pinistramenti TaxID=2705254 RepID=A0ABS5KPQ7_9ACTN|nr:non-ribosomal peptide synthetase [Catenulispora pinistramenti]MBS2548032.1 amino acid adenylation domain-containing protein [Catenulispora pinistramenti]
MNSDGEGNSLHLTAAQRGVWFAQQVEPSPGVYNIGEYLEISGDLDVPLLRRAIEVATAEADVLRTRIESDDDGVRQIVGPAEDVELEILDLAEAADPLADAEEWMRNKIWGEDEQGPGSLKGFALVYLGEDHVLFFLRGSHLVVDAFGAALIAVRISQVYSELAQGGELSPKWFGAVAELVASDREYQAGDDIGQDAEFWRERLLQRPQAVTLSGNRVRVASRTLCYRREFSEADAVGIIEAAKEIGVSTSTTLLAHVAVFLWKSTGQYDVPIGLPVGARTKDTLLAIPGMMSNILPVRLAGHAGQDFAEVARGISAEVRSVMGHQRYRLEQLMHDSKMIAGRTDPLFGVEVNIMNFNANLRFGELQAEFRTISTGPVHDVTLNVRMDAQNRSLGIEIEADSERFRLSDLEAMSQRLLSVLGGVREAGPQVRVGQLTVLSPAERQTLLVARNETDHAVPEVTLADLFAAQAAKTPDQVAVVFGATRLTYRELDEAAERLACSLRAEGVGPERFVALCLPRSEWLVLAVLAVVKSGGAYLPIDIGYPADRIKVMIDDAEPTVVVTLEGLKPTLAGAIGEDQVTIALDASDPARTSDDGSERDIVLAQHSPAYLIYTSGSTGRPKGVVTSHSAIVNRILWMQSAYQLDGSDRVLQKTPASFDVSVWELFWPLSVGATLVVAKPDGHRDPGYLAELIRQEGITVCHFVPSMLRAFLRELRDGDANAASSLKRVICSGELLLPDLRDEFLELTDASLHNLYGPTEAAVDVTASPALRQGVPDGSVPIGRPVWNTQVYVLDAALDPVPDGMVGELYLAGRQLARGYLGQPGLTATRYVANPFGGDGARMYRTGDLARWSADGQLEFVGRGDNQVKVRGFRIEPGDVESAILLLAGVEHAVVVPQPDRFGDARLIGYVTLHDGADVTPDRVREFVAGKLPGYMVPATVMVLDEMPVTANGKVDLKLLPATVFAAQGAGREPRDPFEKSLCEVFADVLGIERIGIDDSFFDLGGHSLAATRAISKVRSALGVELSMRLLFEFPSVSLLAEQVRKLEKTKRPALRARR